MGGSVDVKPKSHCSGYSCWRRQLGRTSLGDYGAPGPLFLACREHATFLWSAAPEIFRLGNLFKTLAVLAWSLTTCETKAPPKHNKLVIVTREPHLIQISSRKRQTCHCWTTSCGRTDLTYTLYSNKFGPSHKGEAHRSGAGRCITRFRLMSD